MTAYTTIWKNGPLHKGIGGIKNIQESRNPNKEVILNCVYSNS